MSKSEEVVERRWFRRRLVRWETCACRAKGPTRTLEGVDIGNGAKESMIW